MARERELLEVVGTTTGARFGAFAAQYRAALADPEQLAVMQALAARFEVLATTDPDHPEVGALAGDLARIGAEQFPGPPDEDWWQPGWQAFLVTLPPAQRRCLELGWERASR